MREWETKESKLFGGHETVRTLCWLRQERRGATRADEPRSRHQRKRGWRRILLNQHFLASQLPCRLHSVSVTPAMLMRTDCKRGPPQCYCASSLVTIHHALHIILCALPAVAEKAWRRLLRDDPVWTAITFSRSFHRSTASTAVPICGCEFHRCRYPRGTLEMHDEPSIAVCTVLYSYCITVRGAESGDCGQFETPHPPPHATMAAVTSPAGRRIGKSTR